MGPARQPRVHVSRALLAQNQTRDLGHTKTNQRLHLLPSTHTLVQPRLSTSPPPPAKHAVPVHIGAGLPARPTTITGAVIQGFVALHYLHHSLAAARHPPCLACQPSQTPPTSVLSRRSHTSLHVSGALAVLPAFTIDASAACLDLTSVLMRLKQCIITRPLHDYTPYDTSSLL